jgi:O-antigen ligase
MSAGMSSMSKPAANIFLPIAFALCCLFAISVALFYPGYASDASILGMLIFLEIVLAAIWNYEQRFFLLLILVFFFAGAGAPPPGFWSAGRWFVLGVGTVAGVAHFLRDHRYRLGGFHLVAFFCLIAAVASCSASLYQRDALFKVFSFSLLFFYAASGMRAAVLQRERQFFSGLLLFCELLTYVAAICYFALHYGLFGNPNSLGAVMGVLVVPMILWGVFATEGTSAQKRLVVVLVLSVLLLATSHARAGILGATISCAVVCIALRRYQALVLLACTGLLAAVAVVFVASPATATEPQSLTSAFIYKGHPESGLLGSRRSAWEETVSSVHEHPWFGTGFGTSATESGVSESGSYFESASRDTREHGNSYLAILEWVGLLGVCPFAALILMVIMNVGKSLKQIRESGTTFSPLIPIVGVVIAGLVNAGFEDWLFAMGYYLCVVFWGLAFVLVDYVSLIERGPDLRSGLAAAASARSIPL